MSNAASIAGHVSLAGGACEEPNRHLARKRVPTAPYHPISHNNYLNPENSSRWDQDLLPQRSGGDKRVVVCSLALGGSPGEIRTPVGGSLLLS